MFIYKHNGLKRESNAAAKPCGLSTFPLHEVHQSKRNHQKSSIWVKVTWTLGETRDETERLVGREGDIVTGPVGEVNEEISL